MRVYNSVLWNLLALITFVHGTRYAAYSVNYEPGPGQGEFGHCGVFVETGPYLSGIGTLFHVVGSVGPGPGMEYRPEYKDRDFKGSPTYQSSTKVGVIDSSRYDSVDSVAKQLPPPPSIFTYDDKTKRWKRKVPAPPNYRCRQWGNDLIRHLNQQSILVPGTPTPEPEPQPQSAGKQGKGTSPQHDTSGSGGYPTNGRPSSAGSRSGSSGNRRARRELSQDTYYHMVKETYYNQTALCSNESDIGQTWSRSVT